MSTATVVFALAPELVIEASYDTTVPPTPDQSHAGPRLLRRSAAPPITRESEGPTINRETSDG